MSLPEFSTRAAQQAAAQGQLEPWLYRYLQAGAWANPGLLTGLQRKRRWWLGPLEIELTRLSRCCGPEPGMEYLVPSDAWDRKTSTLAEHLSDSLEIPPLIVMYDQGQLSVRDGNHRHQAMRRKGWLTCWVVIWHNSLEEFEAGQRALGRT